MQHKMVIELFGKPHEGMTFEFDGTLQEAAQHVVDKLNLGHPILNEDGSIRFYSTEVKNIIV